MKPLLVICPGAIKSGTSSLYYHLYTSYILHFGHGKEHYFLNKIYDQNLNLDVEKFFKENFLTEKLFTFKENHKFKSFDAYANSQLKTLENYKNYFLEISEYYVSHKKMFHGVADFSQSYSELSLNDVKHFRDYITQYFNVKILIMVREPIERLYSYCNMKEEKNSTINAKEYFYDVIKNPSNSQLSIYDRLDLNWGTNVWGDDNVKFFCYDNLFSNVIDDACMFEHSRLYHFLNLPSGNIINNNRFLVKGKYKNKLSQEDINFAKNILRKEYALIHNKFNGLPESWHYAKEWNLDCAKYCSINKQLNPVDYY